MNVYWRKSAVLSLMSLDRWRKEMELQPVAAYLRNCIAQYFQKQDFAVYVPGSAVFIDCYPVDLRMALITAGAVGSHKVRYSQNAVEIFLVRHPHQRSLL